MNIIPTRLPSFMRVGWKKYFGPFISAPPTTNNNKWTGIYTWYTWKKTKGPKPHLNACCCSCCSHSSCCLHCFSRCCCSHRCCTAAVGAVATAVIAEVAVAAAAAATVAADTVAAVAVAVQLLLPQLPQLPLLLPMFLFLLLLLFSRICCAASVAAAAVWCFANYHSLALTTCVRCTFCYHQPMVVIPTKKAFVSRSFTVVSAASVTYDDPLST